MKDSTKKRLPIFIVSVIALILECLPYGVVLNFATGEYGAETIRMTYSYFSLTPFGYATFGPLPAAVLTCVVTLLTLIYIFRPSTGLKSTAGVMSIVAAVLSISPIIFGFDFITVIGVIVTLLLIAEGILFLRPRMKKSYYEEGL